MKRTMDDTWWREVRWRVSLQFLIWGTKSAPDGDARNQLIDAHLDWIDECTRQREMRYRPASEAHKEGRQ